MNKKLILIFITAFLIRLIALNQSLWLDEATTANVVKHFSYFDIVTKFSPHDFHQPLYYWTLKLWTSLFSYSEIALRLPSVMFSLAIGWMVYLIGKKIKDGKTGMWSAAFFLFNPLIVYYSQEARMYMMATFLLTTALYFFIRSDQNFIGRELPRQGRGQTSSPLKNFDRSLIWSNIFLALSFLTFYGSIFFILPLLLYLLYKKRYREFFVSCFVLCASLLLASPLLLKQLVNARASLSNVANWSNVLGQVNLKNLLLIPIKFSVGRISFLPKWFYWGISGIWGFWVFFNVLRSGLRNKFLLYLFISPLIIGLFVSLFTPLLQYFRFLYLIPIMSLLLSLGLKTKWQRIILATGLTIFSFVYLFIPDYHREDWKSLAKNITDQKIYMIPSSSDPLQYYANKIQIADLRNIDKAKENKLTVIPYTSEIYGLNYSSILEKKGYKMRRQNFREVYFEVWEK